MKQNFNWEPRKTKESVEFIVLAGYYSELYKTNSLVPALLQSDSLAEIEAVVDIGLLLLPTLTANCRNKCHSLQSVLKAIQNNEKCTWAKALNQMSLRTGIEFQIVISFSL